MKRIRMNGYGLVGLEKEIFRLAYQAYDEHGFALTNEDIAHRAGISMEFLYEILENIEKKLNSSEYNSD